MDGLPATAAIAGLLAVSGIVIDILWDLNSSPKHDTAVLNLALREVKECRSSINALTKALALLQSRQVPFPDRASWIDVDELVATLTDTVLAFSKLYALACSIEAEAARSSPAAAGRKYEKRLRALCARLKWHNLSIAMMMTIINCPAETDAKNSRDELVHRITRLLTFNLSLSARMQRRIPPSSPPASTYRSPPASSNSSTSSAGPPPLSSSPILPSIPPSTTAACLPPAKPADVGRIPRSSPGCGWPTTAAAASFSGYTLAHPGVLSIICLPISVAELRDDRDYYPVSYLAPGSPISVSVAGSDYHLPLGLDDRRSSSIRSTSMTPSPPGSSWEPKDMPPAVNTQIAGPAAR
ncbi:hypothetical protein B0T10DRAFT_100602 [Thelonectria olida]|uniref:Fungal N-terminal domain-containing protein n=1 Tax=Thelonectria olida TaxID=1576542 RepID=A0A9P8WER5_9HYPO|nr:hypothetical protein B0T10DRAFT_100602 [Thelonectria olida]